MIWMIGVRFHESFLKGFKLLVQSLRCTTAWCKHWPHVPRNLCSRARQPRF